MKETVRAGFRWAPVVEAKTLVSTKTPEVNPNQSPLYALTQYTSVNNMVPRHSKSMTASAFCVSFHGFIV